MGRPIVDRRAMYGDDPICAVAKAGDDGLRATRYYRLGDVLQAVREVLSSGTLIRQILAHLAVAYVGSTLTGTYESFVHRLHRNPVPNSSVAAELLVAMTVGPGLLVPDLQRLRGEPAKAQ
jgi:hypothetical protein